MHMISNEICLLFSRGFILQGIGHQLTSVIVYYLVIMLRQEIDDSCFADGKKSGFIVQILLKAFMLLRSDMIRENIGKKADVKQDASMTQWVQPASTILEKYS